MARDSHHGPLGTHPVSTAIGGVTGAVAAGTTIGSAAGPAGAVAGAAVGAVVGAVGGKLIADVIDPQMEKHFWDRTGLHDDHPEVELEAFQRAHDLAEPGPDAIDDTPQPSHTR